MRTVPASAPHLPSTSGPSSDLLPQFTPSLLDAVFNRSSMKRVPLTQAYPTGLPEPTDQPLPSDQHSNTSLTLSHLSVLRSLRRLYCCLVLSVR